jgi:hypothetical protein
LRAGDACHTYQRGRDGGADYVQLHNESPLPKKAEYAALPGRCKSNAAPGAAAGQSVVPATAVVAVRRRRSGCAAYMYAQKINSHSLHDSGMPAAAWERRPEFLSPAADMRCPRAVMFARHGTYYYF